MLTGSRSENLPILLVQTRKNLQQMFIRLPCTEMTSANPLRISRCVSSFAYPISSNGSFLKYFSASSIEISLFFTFSNTSLASKTFTSFFFFPLFFHTHIRCNIKRKLKPLLCQNLLFSDTANLQLSLF